ncbi:Putative ankyrin repeat protein FPV162 [Araneus ventricosus]|uniref:Ankyrin repeat protein FPV162 n=1 Tax=Araneus ventricosus TaxID=182803 RepID=A0A4Y2BL85_ARAVE|nr:Putative ankyrin repeat protein FPV162 [Araneus ventricosus]
MVFNINEDTELHRLVLCKDVTLPSIRKLLKTGNPNARDAHYDTPLHLAAINENNYEIVAELINAGAQVQICNLTQNTPLHVAVLHCNRRATEVLLQSGADVNSRNILGNSPLHLAVRSSLYRKLEGGFKLCDKLIVEKLIEAGADVNLTNKFNETPLFRAVETGDFDAVQKLLKSGADTNICNYDSTSCLHIALCKLHPDLKLIEELVKNGANINSKDNWFRTPLDLAILKYLNDPSDGFETAMALIRMGVLVHPEVSIDMSRIEEETAVNRLYEFHQVCSSVVSRMKAFRITEVISLYDFALRGMNCTVSSSSKLADEIYSKVLLALLKGNFDLYNDTIECYFPKLYLKKVLMNISIVANSETDQREIELLSDVVWLICDYLNQTDMFQLIKAFAMQNHLKVMIL